MFWTVFTYTSKYGLILEFVVGKDADELDFRLTAYKHTIASLSARARATVLPPHLQIFYLNMTDDSVVPGPRLPLLGLIKYTRILGGTT